MYHTILFDLDGTITDPGEGITNSVAYALEKFGIKTEDKTALYPFIGPPLTDSFCSLYGFSQEKARRAVEYYREYFGPRGIYENKVYEGIRPLLQKLYEAGKRVILATSKPEVFAREILKYFELDQYFTFVAGASLDETRTKKGQVIAHALGCCKVAADEGVIMVGDREHDVVGAAEQGIRTIGVVYGYGSREELAAAGAAAIAESVAALGRLLEGQRE